MPLLSSFLNSSCGKSWKKRHLYSFGIELTARCPFNCRHCYINLPPRDKNAIEKELSDPERFDSLKKE